LIASALYGVQLAVQALDARTVQVEHGYRLSLLGRVAGRRRWIAGNVVGALGWPLQVVALMLAPLTLVQPALGVGLVGVLLAAARRIGERVERRMVAAAGVGILSVKSAFQQRPVAQVVPTAFAIEALVPLALAPLLVGERWPSSVHAAILAAALALVVSGAVALERSAPIARVVEAGHDHVLERAAIALRDGPRTPREVAEART
jgi:hypothetical protein